MTAAQLHRLHDFEIKRLLLPALDFPDPNLAAYKLIQRELPD